MGFTSSQFTQTENLEWMGWDVVCPVLSFSAVSKISDLSVGVIEMFINSSRQANLTFDAYFRPAVLLWCTVCFGGFFLPDCQKKCLYFCK